MNAGWCPRYRPRPAQARLRIDHFKRREREADEQLDRLAAGFDISRRPGEPSSSLTRRLLASFSERAK